MARHQGIEGHEDELGLFQVWADPSDVEGDRIEP